MLCLGGIPMTSCPDPALVTQSHPFVPSPTYRVNPAKEIVRDSLIARGWSLEFQARFSYVYTLSSPVSGDTALPASQLYVTLRNPETPCGTIVGLLSVETTGRRNVDLAKVREDFQRDVIEPLRMQFPTC
jgi:hypothetical protein